MIFEDDRIPLPDFEWYTAKEVQGLFLRPFEEGSIISFNELPPEEFSTVPIVQSALLLLKLLKESGNCVKLLEDESLPVEIVKEIFRNSLIKNLPGEPDESKITTQYNSFVVNTVFSACLCADLIEIQDGTVCLGNEADGALADRNKLFRLLIESMISLDFWFLMEDEDDLGFKSLGYIIVLLNKYAQTENRISFYLHNFMKSARSLYASKDNISDEDVIDSFLYRFFIIIFPQLGIVDITYEEYDEPQYISTNALFRKIISCRPPKHAPKPRTDFFGLGLSPT